MVRSVAFALIALALLAAPASAQTAAPCNGVPAVSDPTGDVTQDAGRQAPAGLDITEAFFRTEAGRTYAFIRVADLSAAAPEDPTVISRRWRMWWSEGNGARWVEARLSREGALSFWAFAGSAESETTGILVEGAAGHVAILLPAAVAKEGSTIAKPYATSNYSSGLHAGGFGATYGGSGDRAPDADAGRDFVVRPCEPPKAPPAPTTAAQSARPAGSAAQQPADLAVVGVGRRTSGRRLAVKLRSTGSLSKVVVTLRRGSKTIGSGRLARIDGEATVVVKASRTLRKGRYTLIARGGGVLTTRKLTLR